MNLLFFPNTSFISSSDDHAIYFSDRRGGGGKYSNGVISKSYFDKTTFWGVYNYKGQHIEIHVEEGHDYTAKSVLDNLIFNSEDTVEKLDSITRKMLYRQIYSPSPSKEFFVMRGVQFVDNKKKRYSIVYNLSDHTYKEHFEKIDLPSKYIDDGFYSVGTATVAGASKLDESLEVKWEYEKLREIKEIEAPKFVDSNSDGKVFKIDNSIIVNLCCERSRRDRVEKVGLHQSTDFENWFIDGRLVSIDCDTGEENWSTVFPIQIDDIEITDAGKVAVACERFIYLVDASSGDILEKIDTGFRSIDYERQISVTLLNDQGYLFLFSYKDCVMQILDSNTLEVLRTIDESERGWNFARFRPRVFGSQIVVPMDLANFPYGAGGMLIIDANDIHAEIEIEDQPEFKMDSPDESNPGHITCSVDFPDWFTVVRYAENALFEEVLLYSDIDRNKHFKTRKIVLNYSGYEDDRALVEQKFEIFKERFEKFIQKPHIPGFGGFPPVELEYNLL